MSKNPHTGDKLQTKVPSDEYRDNYDKIFGKKKYDPHAAKEASRLAVLQDMGYSEKEAQEIVEGLHASKTPQRNTGS